MTCVHLPNGCRTAAYSLIEGLSTPLSPPPVGMMHQSDRPTTVWTHSVELRIHLHLGTETHGQRIACLHPLHTDLRLPRSVCVANSSRDHGQLASKHRTPYKCFSSSVTAPQLGCDCTGLHCSTEDYNGARFQSKHHNRMSTASSRD